MIEVSKFYRGLEMKSIGGWGWGEAGEATGLPLRTRMDGWMKKWVHIDDGWMDEEVDGRRLGTL
jgi:hypothetical protein